VTVCSVVKIYLVDVFSKLGYKQISQAVLGWWVVVGGRGRGPMIFYAQHAKCSQLFHRLLRSRFILSLILI